MAQYWNDYLGNEGWKQTINNGWDSKLTADERVYIDSFLRGWYFNLSKVAGAPNYYDPTQDIPAWESLNEGQRLALTVLSYDDHLANKGTEGNWLPFPITIWFSVGIPGGGQSGAQGIARENDFFKQIAEGSPALGMSMLDIFNHPGTHNFPAQQKPATGGTQTQQPPTGQSPSPSQPSAASGSSIWLLALLGLLLLSNERSA